MPLTECVCSKAICSRCTTPHAVLSVLQGWHQFHCAVDRGADEAERALPAGGEPPTRDRGGEEGSAAQAGRLSAFIP